MIFSAVCFLCVGFVSASSLCSRSTSCPCGSSRKNYTFCLDDVPVERDVCVRWSRCQTCREGTSRCLSCPLGYYGKTCSQVIGLKKIREKRQTTWSEETFQIDSCPPLSPPSSGLIRCRPASRRSRCTGKCKVGDVFEDNDSEVEMILECRRSGWYPRAAFPACVEGSIQIDCPDPGMTGDLIRYPPARSFPGIFKAGERVSFSCPDKGQVIEGSDEITCGADGTWSAPAPQCVVPEAVSCEFPGVDPNGKVFSTNEGPLVPNRMLSPGTRLSFTCNEGYERDGASAVTCRPTGEWSDFFPYCISESTEPDSGVSCPNLGPISNGKATVSSGRRTTDDNDLEYPAGTTVSYSCEIGYAVQGSQRLVCESSGRWSARLPTCIEVCGVTTLEASRRITHGIKTLSGEWPWVVSISVVRGNYTNMICGGALLNRRTVLTAAHCLTGNEPYYVIHFGKFYRIVSKDDDDVEARRSSRITVHRDFDKDTYDNDIALIRFAPTVYYSERVLPICLPTPQSTAENVVPDNKGYVTGWGYTENDRPADQLMMAKLPVQSDATCARSFRTHGVPFRISTAAFCAGFPEGVTSTCRGDSGSALVFYDEPTKRYTVEGCVSFSVRGSCGRPGRYTVFTKVGHFVDWIRRSW